MYIDEDPVNRLLNKSKIINLNSKCNLSVPLVLFRQLRSTILNTVILFNRVVFY